MLVDSSKIGRKAFNNFAPLGKITTIVMDKKISKEYIPMFTKVKIIVIKAYDKTSVILDNEAF